MIPLYNYYSDMLKISLRKFDLQDITLSAILSMIVISEANTFSFPTSAAMAKDYLTVQASSVYSELALFSGTDLVTPN